MALRAKMDTLNRAKQFAPFAALKGFEEAIRAKEKVIIPKAELSEESMEEINEKLLKINTKDIISITYYTGFEYVNVTGMVTKIDGKECFIQVVDTKICFRDIVKMEICN